MKITTAPVLATLICLTTVFFAQQLLAAGYIITDLETLGGTRSIADAINESGQISGESTIAGDTETHAFIYENNSMQDLGTLGGTRASAEGINNLGHITGTNGHAYIFDGTTVQDLIGLGGPTSTGYDINDAGQVTGRSRINDTTTIEHAFFYDGAEFRDLNTLGGDRSVGWSINSSGQIAGSSMVYSWVWHAFIYDPATDEMTDIGTIDGNFSDVSHGYAINDAGHVTGMSETIEESIDHAFFYDGNTIQDLGTLGGRSSSGNGINNHDHVVGRSDTLAGPSTAFLYDGTTMVDLCLMTACHGQGWSDLAATDINDSGDIVGYGDINGETHGFLITWTDQPIPEMCGDGLDNDDDGLTDCEDTDDCGLDARCYVPPGMAYDLIDLDTLGGDYSVGNGINNSGQVTGTSRTVGNVALRAFVYDGGPLEPLPLVEPADTLSRGHAINDYGQMTGLSGYSSFWAEVYVNAFIYDGNNMFDLQPLLNDFCSVGSKSYDINNSAQVTGYCISSYDETWGYQTGNGFLYDGTNMHNLSVHDIQAGTAINNNGDITGGRTTANGTRAFIYDGNSIVDLGDDYSYGNDINDQGHVTGKANLPSGSRAFLYDGTLMHDLGHLGGGHSNGRGINESDKVVGDSSLITGYTAAFLYDDNQMISLCALTDCIAKGWSRLISAADINDRGDITGYGVINGETHAFLALAQIDPVTITGIWPAAANVGEDVSVFLFGDNFTTDGNTEVYFNGVRQLLVAPVSNDMLIVRLAPVSADLFGPVTVTTPAGSATSTTEFGTVLTGLNLTGIWPGDPKIGEWSSIFLFGSGFTTDGSTSVYFNGVRQWMISPVSSEMLIVRVLGDAALSGTVTVVTPAGSVDSVEPLTFVP